jgi:hypothetical protein
MNQYLNNLGAGRKPTPLPDASHLQTSPWWVRGAKSATLKTLKAYTDLVTYLLGFMIPHTASKSVLNMATYIVFAVVWHSRPLDTAKMLAVVTAFTAHAAASSYLQQQLYLAQTEEQRMQTMRAMYREFRAKALM